MFCGDRLFCERRKKLIRVMAQQPSVLPTFTRHRGRIVVCASSNFAVERDSLNLRFRFIRFAHPPLTSTLGVLTRMLNSIVVVSNPADSRSAKKLLPNFPPVGRVWSSCIRGPVNPYITAFECRFVAPSPPHIPTMSGLSSPASRPKKNSTSPGFALRLVARISTSLRFNQPPNRFRAAS